MTPSEFEKLIQEVGSLRKETVYLKSLILETQAMLAQLAPVRVKPTMAQEIAAINAQGMSVIDFQRAKKKKRYSSKQI